MKAPSILILPLFSLLLQPAQAQWVRINGPDSCSINSLVTGGRYLFAGTSKGVFLSADSGGTWKGAGLEGIPVNALGFMGATLYAGTYDRLYYSSDDAVSWHPSAKGVSVLAIVAGGSALWLATTDGVLVSSYPTDSTKWGFYNVGLLSYRGVASLCVNGTDIYAGAYVSGTIYHSNTYGGGWTAIDKNFPTGSWVSCIGVCGSNLIAGIAQSSWGSGLLYTKLNIVSWYVSDFYVYTPLALLTVGPNVFAGTNIDVFVCTNEGLTWTSTAMPVYNGHYPTVNCLAVLGTNLYAGTCCTGIWRRLISEMITSVDAVMTELPREFLLHQNYPNPFNPSTTIRFELPKSSAVRLSVFDILGREVSVLVNERRQAGVHEVKFDGSNLASGVYFYRIQAGDFVQTKKLFLLR